MSMRKEVEHEELMHAESETEGMVLIYAARPNAYTELTGPPGDFPGSQAGGSRRRSQEHRLGESVRRR